MKKLIVVLAVFSMVFSCFVCGCAQKEDSGNTITIKPTDYKKSDYEEMFSDPTTEFRWAAINHSILKVLESSGLTSLSNHAQNWIRTGQGGIVTNISFTKEYLDDPWAFDSLNKAAKVFRNKSINVWLYDEIGYPSGSAAGRTVEGHPEYVAKGLVCIRKTGEGLNPVTVNKDTDLMKLYHAYAVDASGSIIPATVNGDSVTFDGTEGEWSLYVFAEKKLYEGTHAENNGSQGGGGLWLNRDYINIMDKNAVAAFIDNTYKAYAEKYTYFDEVVGIFTDEPSLMEKYQNTNGQTFKYAQLSWVDGFDTEFEKMHGYSILDNLHHVFEGTSDTAKIVRVNYRQTVAELVSTNYFAQISQFCEENGTKLTGHGLLEENIYDHVLYYGDYMQSLREFDIPGVDSLWANPKKYLDYNVFMAVKYATSSGTIMGKDRLSMVEFCAPDISDPANITETEKKWIWTTLNLMYFNGITHVNSYFAIEYLGSDAKTYADYFARLGYISRQAKWDGEVALYYPVNTEQAYSAPSYSESINKSPNAGSINEVAKEMFKNQLDFTVVDNEFILEAEVKDGRLYTENVSFSVVCMPAVEVMPIEVLKKLNEFEAAGGTVVWIRTAPSLPDDLNDIEEFKTLTNGIETYATRAGVQKVKEAVEEKLKIEKATSTLYVGKYTLNGSPMYWLYNYNDVEKELTLTYEGINGFDIYDPRTGEITSVEGSTMTLNVGAYDAKIVIIR